MERWLREYKCSLYKNGDQACDPNTRVKSWTWSYTCGEWRQEDGWDLLATSLTPGSVRDPVSGSKAESDRTVWKEPTILQE